MDCYLDFYERLSVLTKVSPMDDCWDGIDVIKTDISQGIDECYYTKIDIASSAVFSFFERYVADTRMHSALHSHFNTRRFKNYDDLKLVLLIDVIRAYSELDHSTRLNCPEGIALLMLLVKFFRQDFLLTYEGLKNVPPDIINLDGIVPYISACSEVIDVPKDHSVISLLLLEVHPHSDRIYRVAMYRLFEAISEVDGIISQSEKEYLMTLLHLDDNDVSNDIEIDSIFSKLRDSNPN